MSANDTNSGWQPIETAPDNTAVLLYCPNLPDGDEYCFSDSLCRPAAMNNKIVVGIRRGRHDTLLWICDIVETETGYYGDVNANPISIEPTHWMLLPEAP